MRNDANGQQMNLQKGEKKRTLFDFNFPWFIYEYVLISIASANPIRMDFCNKNLCTRIWNKYHVWF